MMVHPSGCWAFASVTPPVWGCGSGFSSSSGSFAPRKSAPRKRSSATMRRTAREPSPLLEDVCWQVEKKKKQRRRRTRANSISIYRAPLEGPPRRRAIELLGGRVAKAPPPARPEQPSLVGFGTGVEIVFILGNLGVGSLVELLRRGRRWSSLIVRPGRVCRCSLPAGHVFRSAHICFLDRAAQPSREGTALFLRRPARRRSSRIPSRGIVVIEGGRGPKKVGADLVERQKIRMSLDRVRIRDPVRPAHPRLAAAVVVG